MYRSERKVELMKNRLIMKYFINELSNGIGEFEYKNCLTYDLLKVLSNNVGSISFKYYFCENLIEICFEKENIEISLLDNDFLSCIELLKKWCLLEISTDKMVGEINRVKKEKQAERDHIYQIYLEYSIFHR